MQIQCKVLIISKHCALYRLFSVHNTAIPSKHLFTVQLFKCAVCSAIPSQPLPLSLSPDEATEFLHYYTDHNLRQKCQNSTFACTFLEISLFKRQMNCEQSILIVKNPQLVFILDRILIAIYDYNLCWNGLTLLSSWTAPVEHHHHHHSSLPSPSLSSSPPSP